MPPALPNSSATLNGNLTTLGSAPAVNVSFEYGPTVAYGSTSIFRVMSTPGAFNITVNGLAPSTTYHFRAKADGGTYGSATGGDMTFTTRAMTVSTLAATEVSNNDAILMGNLTSPGAASSVSVFFEYGLSTAYGNTTKSQTMT